jgi:hypothetical protein
MYQSQQVAILRPDVHPTHEGAALGCCMLLIDAPLQQRSWSMVLFRRFRTRPSDISNQSIK